MPKIPVFLPTPSARRATACADCGRVKTLISTHALREEGDPAAHGSRHQCGISTHALREEGDHLPTSGRGVHENFYPRPPRGGRPQDGAASHSRPYFYPRPPRGGRRRRGSNAPVCYVISTHALREEGDPRRTARPPPRRYFYPRPPRGGRRGVFLRPRNYSRFLPTPSARRATPHDEGLCNFHPFLPTPSARRATYHMMRGFAISTHFYPRPPRGGRHLMGQNDSTFWAISTHALREEGDPERQ